jgi:para-aminobenzoate synthetase/4-amino-4-deoxychorismate lyase
VFATDDPVALFDSNHGDRGALRLSALVHHLRCTAPEDISTTFAAIEAAATQGHWVALSAAYELGHALEAALTPLRASSAIPLLEAWVFSRAETLSDEDVDAWLDEVPPPAGVVGFTPGIDRDAYLAAIARIQAYIAAGDCYQTNFTFPCSARAYGHPHALYRLLRAAQPVSHGAMIIHTGGALLSRSPELFVERRGDTLTCRPMKGTAPAHAAPETLTASDKNRAENLMIVDLIRNDLGRLAPPGGVSVPRLFEAERYATLWQMTSTIEARPVTQSLEAIFRALFPCGSVTGAPKIRAMQIIRELEAAPRQVYCGALGWIAPNGDFSFNVPIRTLEIAPNGEARFGTGSGIVADSVGLDEWHECLLKTRFLNDLPRGFKLIETMRYDAGAATPIPWIEDHLARLEASAAALGFAFDREKIVARLTAHTDGLVGVHRLRLTLAQAGDIELTSAALDPLAHMPTVTLSDRVMDASHPLLRHKTTERAVYDAQLQESIAAGHFDTLFFNDRGELTEGCRSNVFVEIDGELLTPPEDSGLLNGICRRRLLREGQARTVVLTREDLARAQRVLVGNALRGLIEISLVDTPPTPAN